MAEVLVGKDSLREAKISLPIVGYVINLKEREDRWLAIQERFAKVKTIRLERVDAQKGSPGWLYCGKSHISVLTLAKTRGDPFVLVLEDDATIEDPAGFDKRFSELAEWLSVHKEWDVFSGGQHLPKEKPDFTASAILDKRLRIMSLTKSWCAHFMLYSDRAYVKILPWDEKPENPIDVHFSDRLRQVTTVPYLSMQVAGHSDLMGKEWDYTSLFRTSETRLILYFTDRI